MSIPTVDISLYSNQANLALTKGQRLLASLLPSSEDDEKPSAKSWEAFEDEEQQNFVPTTELSGLGAAPSAKDTNLDSAGAGSLEKLRKHMLGKDASRNHPRANSAGPSKHGYSSTGGKAIQTQAGQGREDEGEEELGRSSLGKASKVVAAAKPDVDTEPGSDAIAKRPTVGGPQDEVRGSKRGGNFLDELLEERSQKKKRKKRKKERTLKNADEA